MAIQSFPIKATSHILNLLGDELIGSDSLAIFELVKNSYDADAENVTVSFIDLNTPDQKIVVEDDGNGMSLDIINNVWLTVGTNYKKKEAKISPKYKRFSLGNKGVGRLAVHRLAEEILLETRTEDELFGTRLTINWQKLVHSGKYIEDLFVDVESGADIELPKMKGTRITLSGLKNKQWTKKMLRDLARKIENIKNPFQSIDNFNVVIKCNDEKEEWISDIKTATDILKDSLYYFDFTLSKSVNQDGKTYPDDLAVFKWNYQFRPHRHKGLLDNARKSIDEEQKILRINPKRFADIDESMCDQLQLKNTDLSKIGPIQGRFYVFNQNGALIDTIYGAGKRDAIKSYIRENCGVMIFRDNIRVYNYGEPSDDWLGLEYSKVQRAGDHFSKKVTIGAISLSLRESEAGLIEKTNREGFSENVIYYKFKEIINTVYSFFERIADEDKSKIEEVTNNVTITTKVGLYDTICELQEKIKEKGLEKELSPYVKEVERDYTEMRDVMLSSGMTGLNIGLVFHEVEREMKYINIDLNEPEINVSNLKGRIKNLLLLMEDFGPILKQHTKRTLQASVLVNKALDINRSRFQYHNIIFSSPLLTKENEDFNIYGPSNLLLSSLSNIIDNAIYWVRDKRGIVGGNYKAAIYVGTDLENLGGPAIVVADNGEGFRMDTDTMVRPFKTLKEGGMGLGLYFVNLVMQSIGGKLVFPSRESVDIPPAYNGACVALVFPVTNS